MNKKHYRIRKGSFLWYVKYLSPAIITAAFAIIGLTQIMGH